GSGRRRVVHRQGGRDLRHPRAQRRRQDRRLGVRRGPAEPCRLSLHDALPISSDRANATYQMRYAELVKSAGAAESSPTVTNSARSEEHTSELQSPCKLVCRLLLEKKKAERNVRCNALAPGSIETDMTKHIIND